MFVDVLIIEELLVGKEELLLDSIEVEFIKRPPSVIMSSHFYLAKSEWEEKPHILDESISLDISVSEEGDC